MTTTQIVPRHCRHLLIALALLFGPGCGPELVLGCEGDFCEEGSELDQELNCTGKHAGHPKCAPAAPEPPPPAEVCGDGVCTSAETCSNCSADCGACPAPVPTAPALWHADADTNGMSAWKGQQEAYADRLDIVSDPEGKYGKVYQAMLLDGDRYTDGKARCELYGSKLPNGANLRHYEGDNHFFGWRSRINHGFDAPLTRSNSGNLSQFKGDSSCGGPAVGLTIKYGRITLRSELYGELWVGPLVTSFAGAWHDFVVNINFSKHAAVGYLQVWLDGVPQTLVNGQQRMHVATMCPNDGYVYLKQGVYRSTELKGAAYHWIESTRIGTSYEAVVPR